MISHDALGESWTNQRFGWLRHTPVHQWAAATKTNAPRQTPKPGRASMFLYTALETVNTLWYILKKSTRQTWQSHPPIWKNTRHWRVAGAYFPPWCYTNKIHYYYNFSLSDWTTSSQKTLLCWRMPLVKCGIFLNGGVNRLLLFVIFSHTLCLLKNVFYYYMIYHILSYYITITVRRGQPVIQNMEVLSWQSHSVFHSSRLPKKTPVAIATQSLPHISET